MKICLRTFIMIRTSQRVTESYGLPLLELKVDYIKPIKQIPSLSKLINGDYQTEKSKSDYQIAKDITFITNKLLSFKEYKNMIYHISR